VKFKNVISKILVALLWLSVGSGMLLLLVAAVNKKNALLCSDLIIEVNSEDDNKFIDEKDVMYLVKSFTRGKVQGERISEFDLHAIELMLEKNVWVKDAELYFDNLSVLNVAVKVRSPLARIISTENGSFYIDETGMVMPLSDKVSARVPLFTGFPEKKRWDKKDSVLIDEIKAIANCINNDPFWEAQVSQIVITEARTFEMVPVLGDHIVNIGTANDIEKKLKKLFVFYKEVLAKSGFDKYRVIDLQYAGQVVGKPKGSSPLMVDSVAFRKNVESIIEKEKLLNVIANKNTNPEKPSQNADFVEQKPINKTLSDIPKADPDPVKTTQSVFEEVKKDDKKIPKAVMPKKENN
jgi:cell division protein FtsQ